MILINKENSSLPPFTQGHRVLLKQKFSCTGEAVQHRSYFTDGKTEAHRHLPVQDRTENLWQDQHRLLITGVCMCWGLGRATELPCTQMPVARAEEHTSKRPVYPFSKPQSSSLKRNINAMRLFWGFSFSNIHCFLAPGVIFTPKIVMYYCYLHKFALSLIWKV